MAQDNNCGICNLGLATFSFSPVSGEAPMYDEGDIVTYDVEETEFDEHYSHDGSLLIGSYKGFTKVQITLMAFPCSEWYREMYEVWKADKGVCGDIVVNDPCCDVEVFERGRITKMGKKPVSYDNAAVEIVFTALIVQGN
jgi:hypothetical protein